MNVTLDINNDELLCLRMALVNRLNWIERCEQRKGTDEFLTREKRLSHHLLTVLPEQIDDTTGAVRDLLAANKFIHAVKLYRERTGASLKDAKDAVERIRDGVAA